MRFGIVTKLWLASLVFVLIIIVSLGMIWSQLFERYYFAAQADKMLAEGQAIVDLHRRMDNQEFLALVEAIAAVLESEVLVSSNSRDLAGCLPFDHVSQDMLITAVERQQLLAGAAVVRKGWHPRFDSQILAVALPLFRDGDMEGAVFLYAPYASILATVGEVRHLILLGAFIIAGTAVLLSFFLSRSVSRPLLEINRITRRISDGDFASRATVASGDEIGQLAGSINHLAGTLSLYIADIKRQDKMRRDLVANVSHELRTPLTYVQGYTELLIDGGSTTREQRQFLEKILEETLRLRRLVDSLLALSRLDDGQLGEKKEPIELDEVVFSVVTKLKPTAIEKGIELLVAAPAGLAPVCAAGDQVERVLWNLVDNALRFTGPGGYVKVELLPVEDGIRVDVIDNGCGIPEEDLPYIWERFYKVDKARTSGSGTGLGLAIVKSIVEEHGGNVAVVSRWGGGSVFSFTLPLEHCPAEKKLPHRVPDWGNHSNSL